MLVVEHGETKADDRALGEQLRAHLGGGALGERRLGSRGALGEERRAMMRLKFRKAAGGHRAEALEPTRADLGKRVD